MSLGEPSAAAPSENGANGAVAPPAPVEGDRNVQEVLSSEIGISTMITRLKQSILTTREFANFLKKRATLEEEHAQGLKRICRTSQDIFHRGDYRAGTFARAMDETMAMHERMADNEMQFASSLHQMHDDLAEMCAMAEKSRKGWKASGLAAEQRVADLQTAVRKSKAKYDSLADEFERAKTGDPSSQKPRFGLKMPKSAAQHEEDLSRKVNGADADYHNKVQTLQQERGDLLNRTRPETIKALQELIRECDSMLVGQMQKFATFNEKLLLSNGMSISPLKNAEKKAPALRDVVASIDNEKDFNDFIGSHFSSMPPKSAEPKYERHPVLNSQAPQTYTAPSGPPNTSFGEAPFRTMNASGTVLPGLSGPGGSSSAMGGNTPQKPPSRGGGGPGGYTGSPISPQGPQSFGHSQSGSFSGAVMPAAQRAGGLDGRHERSFSHGSFASQSNAPPPQQAALRNSAGQPVLNSKFNNSQSALGGSQGPPQLGALPFQTSQKEGPSVTDVSPPPGPPPGMTNPLSQHPPSNQTSFNQSTSSQPPFMQSAHSQPPTQDQAPPRAAPAASHAPAKPVFGISLEKLYDRDQLAVPMVVYQCIQAVDMYGLGVEGIYRLSGSVPHVNSLKSMFETDSNSPKLDFRNPENFYNDVNSVAGLLKQFFRDLPDPLLTMEHYAALVDAAKVDDDTVRRDSLHAIINSLPDPNYATLRALVLHLHRVMEQSATNRMSSQNLAIVFGPTLMGTAPGSNIADAGWQVRVVDTILQNTYQIFDDD